MLKTEFCEQGHLLASREIPVDKENLRASEDATSAFNAKGVPTRELFPAHGEAVLLEEIRQELKLSVIS